MARIYGDAGETNPDKSELLELAVLLKKMGMHGEAVTAGLHAQPINLEQPFDAVVHGWRMRIGCRSIQMSSSVRDLSNLECEFVVLGSTLTDSFDSKQSEKKKNLPATNDGDHAGLDFSKRFTNWQSKQRRLLVATQQACNSVWQGDG